MTAAELCTENACSSSLARRRYAVALPRTVRSKWGFSTRR